MSCGFYSTFFSRSRLLCVHIRIAICETGRCYRVCFVIDHTLPTGFTGKPGNKELDQRSAISGTKYIYILQNANTHWHRHTLPAKCVLELSSVALTPRVHVHSWSLFYPTHPQQFCLPFPLPTHLFLISVCPTFPVSWPVSIRTTPWCTRDWFDIGLLVCLTNTTHGSETVWCGIFLCHNVNKELIQKKLHELTH